MKKLLYLVIGLCFLSSCGGSDNGVKDIIDPSSPENLLVKRITAINSSEGYSIIEEFSYDGNKIVEVRSDYYGIKKFTYTNNLISRVVKYDKDNPDVVDYTITYSYDSSGKVETYKWEYNNFWDSNELEYTSNGDFTVSYKNSNGDVDSGNFYVEDGNVVKIESSEYVSDLSYDTKNTPFKNIVGASNISLLNFWDEPFSLSELYGNKNNLIQEKYRNIKNDIIHTNDYLYDYNELDYPRNVTVSNSGEELITIEYY